MNSIYAGAFIGVWVEDEFYVVCVTDRKYHGNYKMPGGMAEQATFGAGNPEVLETPEQTMIREVNHETGVQVLESILVLTETMRNHVRYFFLATKVSGLMTPGMTRKFREEKAGRVAEETTAHMVPLTEFAGRLFYRQFPAFQSILECLAVDRKFFNKYADLIGKLVLHNLE